ncbi:MAG: hypothetical protein HOV81_15585 [Kofleriaceae bacterium]|nr:hypothetical protein [Kofleriaceae bacterium]
MLREAGAIDPAQLGAPSAESIAQCDVRTIARAADPAWFDAWRSGSMRAIAEKDLGAGLAALDAADHVTLIQVAPTAPKDLTYLQGAWAIARHLAARGASSFFDAHAISFRPADKVQAAGESFEIRREISVVYETSKERPDQAHALHTRGMRKFGAPDLIALCTDADVPLVAHAVTELADMVARGTDLATPKHAVEVAPGVRWVAVEDQHRLGELLQLNNEARVLVDETGHDLMGVMSRLPRASS